MTDDALIADANLSELARLRTSVRDLREIIAQQQRDLDDARKTTAEFDRMRLLACQEVERIAPLAQKSRELQADLIFLRAECDGAKERLAQSERDLDAERAARRAFEADAAQLKAAALAYVVSATYEDRARLRAELHVLATVAHPGVLLLNELTLLRELADDLIRWREAGGDIRDLAYVFETMDKIEQRSEDNVQ